MKQRTILTIAIVAVLISVGSVVYAATTTKYFQRIKQTTYEGNVTVKITAGDERTSRESQIEALRTWEPGDSIPESGCDTLARYEPSTFNPATCHVGSYMTKYERKYTYTITGLPDIPWFGDPPIFYNRVRYWDDNGKEVPKPTNGSKYYLYKTITTTVFYDGHTADDAPNTIATPSVGTHTYKYHGVILQPSN